MSFEHAIVIRAEAYYDLILVLSDAVVIQPE